MKSLLIILLTFTNFQILGNDLTSSESQRLSEDLDNSCGDSWCEGEYNWSVDNFTCSFEDQKCTVELTLIEEFDFNNLEDCSPEELLATEDTYCLTSKQVEERFNFLSKKLNVDMDADFMEKNILWTQTCTINNVTNKDFLFESSDWSSNLYNYSYSNDVYESVLDCVTEIEETYWNATSDL